jgi:hypothetical protein
LQLFRIDWRPSRDQPSALRVLLASVVAIAGSSAADAVLVGLGTRVFPSTKGYVHFHFANYAKLTVIGVVIACVARPIVTRITPAPRWLFFRSAILVTLVLLLPDVYLPWKGQPPKAVAVLVCMHLAIALVTYNSLVHMAPVGRTGSRRQRGPDHDQPAKGSSSV